VNRSTLNNQRLTDVVNKLYWDMRKASRRAANAARDAQLEFGRESGEALHHQARAEAYAHAVQYLRMEKLERKRGRR